MAKNACKTRPMMDRRILGLIANLIRSRPLTGTIMLLTLTRVNYIRSHAAGDKNDQMAKVDKQVKRLDTRLKGIPKSPSDNVDIDDRHNGNLNP